MKYEISRKKLRACQDCKLVKTIDEFREYGCDNCLKETNSDYNVRGNTTKIFKGMVAIFEPNESWVSRWLKNQNNLPGLYAISVQEKIDNYYEEEFDNSE